MFAVGLLAGNVPEGLLPVITLALAVAVRLLARRGALVKRLSAVETLGSTDVICTDKTGTLTENRMRPVAVWTLAGEVALDAERTSGSRRAQRCRAHGPGRGRRRLQQRSPERRRPEQRTTRPRSRCCIDGAGARRRVDAPAASAHAAHQYNFDPQRKLMSTLDAGEGHDWLHTKGAPESVLPRCTTRAPAPMVRAPDAAD